ncbi:uncharacterized protein F4807DRAFT_350491 [Annulohypoxylon truncatum]|uniref:uncharacterized protein n=1 Tax=Annulohypoxylon truncatum TaxID=327061 RepID=UPI0020079078|nr:uncharacterized protein F4807DRAFT_350491 [Annulohypoxylon truncatum]KAI1212799.1 hypothetical protein F4807DRAFT_350491 [Annulohypoxylon truncatum]
MAPSQPPPPPRQVLSQIPRPPRFTFRARVLTGAFAAVAVVGAIYGAGLKTQQEYNREKQKIAEASAEDRIRNLEERRTALLAQRRPIERKLNDLRARMRAQELKDAAAAAAAATNQSGK